MASTSSAMPIDFTGKVVIVTGKYWFLIIALIDATFVLLQATGPLDTKELAWVVPVDKNRSTTGGQSGLPYLPQ